MATSQHIRIFLLLTITCFLFQPTPVSGSDNVSQDIDSCNVGVVSGGADHNLPLAKAGSTDVPAPPQVSYIQDTSFLILCHRLPVYVLYVTLLSDF